MADIFNHPNNEPDYTVEKFELEDGIVIIKSKAGDLTLSNALFFLKLVENYILNLAQKNEMDLQQPR